MNLLKLTEINPGNGADPAIVSKIQNWDGHAIIFHERSFEILDKSGYKVHESGMLEVEHDFFSKTYHSFMGTQLIRLVFIGDEAAEITKVLGKPDPLTFASPDGNGFAVHFDLMSVS